MTIIEGHKKKLKEDKEKICRKIISEC